VAVAAGLVARGGARLLGLVAATAGGSLRAAVRLMTADALRVTGVRGGPLRHVARLTTGEGEQWLVGQAAVAALACAVPLGVLGLGDLRGVATLARAMVGAFAHEVVGGVAALALYPCVEGRLLRRGLVTGAARRGSGDLLIGSRVRIVTADAGPGGAVLGVVGLLSRVAAGASLLSAAPNVVGLVAALAVCVRRDLRLAQHEDVFVARPARRGLGLAKVVRSVAAHALQVPPFEQRGRRHDWLLLGVTLCAAAQRFFGRRVLLLMAGGANRVRRLTVGGVGGRDVLVALSAGTGLRARVLVGSVTVQARLLGVYLNRGGLPLSFQMAVGAVAGLMRVHAQLHARGRGFDGAERLLFAEAVTQGAVAGDGGAELGERLRACVLDFCFLFVARPAALRAHGSNVTVGDGVAGRAAHLLLHDVDVVAGGLANRGPSGGDINAEPGVEVARAIPTGARDDERQQGEVPQPETAAGTPVSDHGAALRPGRRPASTGPPP
jgi:hypothetical protein